MAKQETHKGGKVREKSRTVLYTLKCKHTQRKTLLWMTQL